jgi:copper oxidase (laccase) domain-containing protein
MDGVDGHLTGTPGVMLSVTVADCVPVYLIHPPSRTIGLLHAGWRGVAAGILETGISSLVDLCGGTVFDIVIHCGISICGECYKVGHEVRTAVMGVPSEGGLLDLRAVLAARAGRLGAARVTASGWCAAHHRDRFFSHRASGGRDGRMVAYLGVPRA